MTLINRYGTQPQTAAQRRGGNGGGNNRAAGGGGNRGGGGGGNNRLPNVGLYAGKAGRAQANANPEAFFRSAVSNVGGLDYSGTPISEYADLFVAKLLDDYNAAMSSNQRLDATEWLRDTTGAGYGGKKGRTFDPGQLGLSGGALDAAYTDYYSNTNPRDYLVGQAGQQGGYVAGGGNADFQRFYQESYVPQLQAELAARRADEPKLSMADLVAGRNLGDEARRRYLARPSSQRLPGPANLAGRYSWWD